MRTYAKSKTGSMYHIVRVDKGKALCSSLIKLAPPALWEQRGVPPHMLCSSCRNNAGKPVA